MGDSLDLRDATVTDLLRVLVPRRSPPSEIMGRHYWGRSLKPATIEQAIRSAESGLMAAITDMENESISLDGHASSTLAKRFGEVSALDWSLTPAAGDGIDRAMARMITDEVRCQLQQIHDFNERLYDLAWGAFHGRSALEVGWAVQSGPIRWKAESLDWIHPRRLSFGPSRELRLVDTWRHAGGFTESGFALEDFPGKFVWWCPRMFGDYQEKEGLGPRLLYWCFFKRFSWRMRMILTELFAIPWRIIEVDKDAPIDWNKIQKAVEQVEKLGQDSTAGLAPGMKLQLSKAEGKMADLFSMTNREVNEEISKLVLLQTGTTDAVANRAEAIVHKGEQDIGLGSDARRIASRIQQQLVDVIVGLNWGPSNLRYSPGFKLHAEAQRDVTAELSNIGQMLTWGLPVAEEEIRDLTGYRAPEEDETYVVLDSAGGTDAMGQPLPAKMRIVDPKAKAEAAEKDPTADAGELEAGGTDQAADNAEDDLLVAAGRGGAPLRPFFGSRFAHLLSQPFGSPVDVMDAELETGRGAMQTMVDELVAAAGKAQTPSEAMQLVEQAAANWDPSELETAIFAIGIRAAMLGADDSAAEAAEDKPVDVEAFTRLLAIDIPEPPPGMDDATGFVPGDVPDVTGISGPVQPAGPDPNGFIAKGKLRPKRFWEAIDDFLERGSVTRETWDAMSAAEQSHAFTVAHLASEEAVKVIQDEITKSMLRGDGLREFRKALAKRIKDSGLTSSHIETVYRNATMKSYNEGRRAHMDQPHVMEALPWRQAVTVNDGQPRQRETHQHVHGWVMRADDPSWARTPWGHNCRCRIVARSQKWVDENAPHIHSGPLPNLPDPGWS